MLVGAGCWGRRRCAHCCRTQRAWPPPAASALGPPRGCLHACRLLHALPSLCDGVPLCLQADLELLREFAEEDAVTWQGVRVEAK